MQWTISRKLFASLVIIALVILVMSAVFGRLSFQRGFHAYLDARETPLVEQLAEELEGEYSATTGWANLENEPRRWRSLMRISGQMVGRPDSGGRRGDRFGPGPRDGPPPGRDPLRIGARLGLYDMEGDYIAGAMVEFKGASLTDVEVDGKVVGQLRIAPSLDFESDLDIEFDRQQSRSILFIALILLGLTALASFVIAKQFTRPIRRLADGTRAIAKGNYNQPVTVDTGDELGALASDVNSLAQVLNDNRESRRRWLADINHEMRTPLAVMRAELHSLEDGVRPFDKNAVVSLQAEVGRLQQLTEDLYSLSAADEGSLEYNFAPLDVNTLLRELVDANRLRLNEQGLTLELRGADKPAFVQADAVRLTQLLTNLMENSARYTDAPGTVQISASRSALDWKVSIADTAPGVPSSLHEKIFERLYRVDGSRTRSTGGSGLGLSICAAIVAAHEGEITAAVSPLGGLQVDVTLPLSAS